MSSILIGWSRAVFILFLCTAGIFAQNSPATVSVDANASRHPISPKIYGFAFGSKSDLAATNFTMNRSGGNGTSTYDWQINASNHASDWYFESILDPPETPGYDGDTFISQTRAGNATAQPLLTIPMINYLAKLGPGGAMLWSFSIAKYGPQTGSDPYQPDAGNGTSSATGKPITGNNPLDANTPNSVSIQQAWVQHLISTWGLAASGGLEYYIMDNEPSLWSSTHRDIHPAPETYNEIYNDIVNYAGTVRALDPNAIIVGPEEWSWWAMFVSGYDQQNGISAAGSDYNTHSQTYYYPWLLQQLYAYQQSTGKQLLNVLSAHYYPQELSNSDDDSLSAQLTRNQSTRALWDPNYVDPSWFNQVGINGGIVNMIPTMKNWVSQYYPGLQTAITEYNWGDETNLNGATTQADVLGIFGREGLDIATRWTVPANPSPTYLALEIYRNYDGKLSTFGDTSVSASVANPDNLSSFGAVRSSDGALTVMVINKQQGTTPVTISLANFGTTGTAQAYQIASASQTSITQLGSLPVTNNAITTTLPSQSITMFVIPSGNITSVPSAPTGLAATVGSGTATLTWSAGGGASSYTVKRGAVSGGPYTSLGTVAGTSPTYTDNGLTNGTTYYYVVSGSNTAGSGPNSAELAVTPIVPPTFSSSASASPNPVAQGAGTTIQATVTCTSNSLTNGNVQILVLDPNGNTAATQNYASQNFTAQQSHSYSMNLTPAIAGTYTIEVGVFSATWQLWNWNSAAATVTVNSSVVFSSSAMAPSTSAAGGTASISLTVTETGPGSLTNGNVELQVFNSSGSAVATQVWSSQNFTTGQARQYSYTWSPASTLPPGNYSVDIGVFDSTWGHDYYWNTDATIALTAPVTNTDLAIGKPAAQSSTISGYGPANASNAVDGNTDGNFADGSVSHTNDDANAWWEVDLGSSASISSIATWNRTDCCSNRLSDYWVFVSNTPFSSTDTPTTLQARAGTWSSHQTSYPNPSTTIAVNAQGRYVRVQLSGTNYLSLAEVQVFGSSSGITTYGISGQVTLSGTGLSGVTVTLSGPQSGSVTSDASGNYSFSGLAAAGNYTVTPTLTGYSFTPPSQTFNSLSAPQTASFTASVVTTNTDLALGKAATQSSTLAGYGSTTAASSALDGNTDGNFFDGSVSHTNDDANAWWEVDLGSSATIGSVVIWNRTDCCSNRLNDYWVFVSNAPFLSTDTPATLQSRAGTWNSHQTTYPNPSTTIAVNASGRYVRVQLSGTNYLSLAEVQVFGSSSGITTYGISGQVTLSGTGLSGVTMTLGGSQSGSVTSSGSGNYSFTGLAAVGNYTVTPTLAGYSFTPPSQTYNNLSANQTANFTASAATSSDLAIGKTATQSSTLAGYGPTTAASSAVDGNTDGNFFDGSVSHTNDDANAWWEVDLGASATINSIAIWNRTDCCSNRLSDYWVFVSNTPFLSTDTPTTLQSRAATWSNHQTSYPNASTTIPASATGRYVRVQLSGTNYLSLAEVQVFGTP